MSSRTIRDHSDKIGLFPFLAVLLCTMGALLILLVVLAEKAKHQGLDNVASQASTTAPDLAAVDAANGEEARKLEQQLDRLHRTQQQLATLRAKALSRQHEEQLRLTHLEEHARRLEHELAKLYLASEQLKATKEKQIVDQGQAEHELARLKELIEENRQDLQTMREQSRGKRSYAIIPYQGPQGTVRRPIYVECSKEGVVIQPEGIRLTADDFIAPFDSGNPLAKALRAARDLLNARAAQAGESEPPDPYPLLVVRPDGIRQYAAARTAIESWDADFGYEFINTQWSLQYPDTDPELALAMRHAVLQGRERIAMLIQAAPRRYGQIGIGTSLGRHGGGGRGPTGEYARGNSSVSGWGPGGTQSASSDFGTNQEAGTGGQGRGRVTKDAGSGTGLFTGEDSPDDGNLAREHLAGSMETGTTLGRGMANGNHASHGKMGIFSTAQGPVATRSSKSYSETLPGASGGPARAQAGYGKSVQTDTGKNSPLAGPQQAGSQRAGPAGAGQTVVNRINGSQSGTFGAVSSAAGGSASGVVSARGSGSSSGAVSAQAGGGIHASNGSTGSKAGSPGNNWALQNPQRGAVPIRRPIHVVIRQDRMAILRSRDSDTDSSYQGAVISMDQPVDQIMAEFVTALREHMKDWGLAGNGLFWRPVLKLNIGPRGQKQAARMSRLLEDSGVEIDWPRTARQRPEVPTQATR